MHSPCRRRAARQTPRSAPALAWAGADVLAGQPGAGAGAAYIMSESAAGDAICTAHEEDGATKYSCPLALGDSRLILRGSGLVDNNQFTISSSHMTVNGDPVMAGLVVEIGRVVEVATVSLELADGQSSSAETGSNVAMVLRIRSNRDRPAQPSAIQSILLTAEGGSLSSPAGQAGSCSGVGLHHQYRQPAQHRRSQPYGRDRADLADAARNREQARARNGHAKKRVAENGVTHDQGDRRPRRRCR